MPALSDTCPLPPPTPHGPLPCRAAPLILPFYHSGMGDVMPKGAQVPCTGATVVITIGEEGGGRQVPHVGPIMVITIGSGEAAGPRYCRYSRGRYRTSASAGW